MAKDARDAAEDARLIARRRSLVEELDDASHKLQQVGNFLHQQQWAAVQLRVDEILAICKTAMARWPDHLSEDRRNGVIAAMAQIETIAAQVSDVSQRQASAAERKKLTGTHLRASGLINLALGEARREEER